MATETSSEYASATDELIVKKEKDEAIAQMIASSLANEDGESKHDNKPDDAQDEATPPSKTEVEAEEAEEGEKKTEIGEDKSHDSPSLETPAEDDVEHEEVEEAQVASLPSTNTEGEAEADDKKDEPDGIVEKSGDPVTREQNVAGYSNEEKEQISEAQSTSAAEPEEIPVIDPAVEETLQLLEKGSIESEEEKQAKTVDILKQSAETIEKSSDATEEAKAPAAEPEAELVVKEAEASETTLEKEEKPELEPEPVATVVKVKTEEPENESQEKPQEIEQQSSVLIPESSAEVKEEPTDVLEENTRDVPVDALKEINKDETESAETEKTEPVFSEIEKNPKEPENQPLEQKEEQTNAGAIPEHSAETIDHAAEGKTREPEPAVQTFKETKDNESGPTETEKEEPVVNNEQSSRQEKEDLQEKAEPEPEPEPKTVIPEIVAENVMKPSDKVEVHPPIESNTELVKESGNSESEVVPEKEEPETELEPEPASTEVDGKPREQLEVSEKVEETSKDNVEAKKEILNDTNTKIEGASDDTIKEPVSLKEEETSIAENTPQAPSNLVEPSQEVAENVVEEDECKKESSFTNVIEEAPKEVAEVVKIPEQGSTDEEAKTCIVEDREYPAPTNVQEKTIVAENDDKKQPETAAPDAISRDAEVDINNVEEQKETTTGKKVDEISAAVGDPVRETLASKFEQQEEESSAKTEADNSEQHGEEPAKSEVEESKESDATKTSRDIPKEASAKPAQKQSNNIISKVKQSLVKAKKAIIGKSPSSKNHSSDAKGDIKVN